MASMNWCSQFIGTGCGNRIVSLCCWLVELLWLARDLHESTYILPPLRSLGDGTAMFSSSFELYAISAEIEKQFCRKKGQ
jgi:hypothetical protein